LFIGTSSVSSVSSLRAVFNDLIGDEAADNSGDLVTNLETVLAGLFLFRKLEVGRRATGGKGMEGAVLVVREERLLVGGFLVLVLADVQGKVDPSGGVAGKESHQDLYHELAFIIGHTGRDYYSCYFRLSVHLANLEIGSVKRETLRESTVTLLWLSLR